MSISSQSIYRNVFHQQCRTFTCTCTCGCTGYIDCVNCQRAVWDLQKGTRAPLHVYYSKYSFNVPLTVHTEPAAALWPFKQTFAPSIVQWVGTFLNLCALHKFDKCRKFRCALSPLTANDELLTICTRSFWSIKLVHNENLVRMQFHSPPQLATTTWQERLEIYVLLTKCLCTRDGCLTHPSSVWTQDSICSWEQCRSEAVTKDESAWHLNIGPR